MDDASSFVPNRENTSLHLDRNNETVVSGMTECSWETPSAASVFTSSSSEGAAAGAARGPLARRASLATGVPRRSSLLRRASLAAVVDTARGQEGELVILYKLLAAAP